MGGPLGGLIQAISARDAASALAYASVIAVILLVAFPLHELAHALVADYFGDPTPRLAGRITLNPIKHLSLMGSIFFLVFGFGWATTPINPYNFRGDYRMKHAAVAIAGPLMNIAVALVFTLIYHLAALLLNPASGLFTVVGMTCGLAVQINLFLAFFNLIPLPPLDGGTVLMAFAPENIRSLMAQIGQYGFIVVLLLSQLGLIRTLVTVPASQLAQFLLAL